MVCDYLLSTWPVNLKDFIQTGLDGTLVTWCALKRNWRHLIGWWLVLLSEKGERVTEDQFHVITTEDSFFQIRFFGGYSESDRGAEKCLSEHL